MSYIDEDGVYHKGKDKPMGHDIDNQFRGWSHDNQRKRLGGDIIQPFINGKPNREFIEVYKGEVADKYFNQDQQDKAMRSMS